MGSTPSVSTACISSMRAENTVQFGLGRVQIALGEFEAGKLGNMADFVEGQGHGNLQSCLNDKGL
jgi:hypothetical protein